MSGFDLNAGCPACDVPVGEHQVAEWLAHHGRSLSFDLPYEAVDPPVILDPDGRPIADNIVARSGVLGDGSLGVAAVLLDFSVAHADAPPTAVAAVTFVGSADVLRRVGVVVRDACNGAANTLGGRR